MTATPPKPEHPDVPRIVIFGSDAALGVRPNTTVQFAHACLLAGYSLAVPATWGDELVAQECLRQLSEQPTGTLVMCSCPLVRRRLFSRGAELAPFMVSLVSPPVATARYVRALAGRPVRIHFVGRCPSAADESIDRWIDPDDFVDMLDEKGIDIAAQPTSFEGVLPPDRRRHCSLPGGFPAPDQLWEGGARRKRVEPAPEQDLADAVVEGLLSSEPQLLDLAPSLQCACSGVVTGVPPRTARARVTLTEPPRSPSPVVDHTVSIVLTERIDVTATQFAQIDSEPPPFRTSAPHRRETVPGIRLATETSAARRRPSSSTTVRPSPTSVPVSRQSDGRLVPRAYAARRRPTPPSGSPHPAQPEAPPGSGDEGGDQEGQTLLQALSEHCEPRHSPALGIAAPLAE